MISVPIERGVEGSGASRDGAASEASAEVVQGDIQALVALTPLFEKTELAEFRQPLSANSEKTNGLGLAPGLGKEFKGPRLQLVIST